MLLRETVRAEILGLMKAQGFGSMEAQAGLLLTQLQRRDGHFEEWFFKVFGKSNRSKRLLISISGYWDHYLKREFVV